MRVKPLSLALHVPQQMARDKWSTFLDSFLASNANICKIEMLESELSARVKSLRAAIERDRYPVEAVLRNGAVYVFRKELLE